MQVMQQQLVHQLRVATLLTQRQRVAAVVDMPAVVVVDMKEAGTSNL
jgi:hypothetical protein